MKILVLAVTAIGIAFVSGCASQAPAQNYRPPGSTDAAWQIDGTSTNTGTGGANIEIRINGELAITGALTLLGGNAELRGTYKDQPVSASCSTSQGLFTGPKRQCIVFVQNERAATLQF